MVVQPVRGPALAVEDLLHSRLVPASGPLGVVRVGVQAVGRAFDRVAKQLVE